MPSSSSNHDSRAVARSRSDDAQIVLDPRLEEVNAQSQRPRGAACAPNRWTESQKHALVTVAMAHGNHLLNGCSLREWGVILEEAWQEHSGETQKTVSRVFSKLVDARIKEIRRATDDASGTENLSELKQRLDYFIETIWDHLQAEKERVKDARKRKKQQDDLAQRDRTRFMLARTRNRSSLGSASDSAEVVTLDGGNPSDVEEVTETPSAVVTQQRRRQASSSSLEQQAIHNRFLTSASSWFEHEKDRDNQSDLAVAAMQEEMRGLKESNEALQEEMRGLKEAMQGKVPQRSAG